MDRATQSQDVERIRRLVARVDGKAPISRAEINEILETFERYECWTPYFRLLKRSLDDPANRRVDDYVRLARVQNLYLEDVFSAAETCVALVRDMRLGYVAFSEEVLPQVVEFEDYSAEATLLSAVASAFADKSDKVACLERLCMLYEKKTHNETQLANTYEMLIEVDPRNVKALRYFKLVFTQENRWEEVVGILRTLLGCVTHPQELFRVAQELSAIYLYQLDMPEEAIKTLDTFCADSPLDTSTILYDAYHRLADWAGCLRVLRECLLSVEGDTGRAILHYKIAGLHEHLGQLDEALDNFEKAANLWPGFLDAVEGVVGVAIGKRDWRKVHHWLVELAERVEDSRLAGQLRQAYRRLEDGMSHATAKNA